MHELGIADDESLLVAFDIVQAHSELGQAILFVRQVHIHRHSPLSYFRSHLFDDVSQKTDFVFDFFPTGADVVLQGCTRLRLQLLFQIFHLILKNMHYRPRHIFFLIFLQSRCGDGVSFLES